jgi:SAM-dependent methyltransferase
MGAGVDIYDEALGAEWAALRARWSDGTTLELPIKRWLGPPTPGDESVLTRVAGPVLDVGCGPGRLLVALQQRGVEALGVDISRTAVAIAHGRGARAVTASVFDGLALPGPLRSAVLLDGNIGIGGDPVRLLRRIGRLLAPAGRVIVELDAPGTPTTSGVVRLEGRRLRSDPFPWARIAVDLMGATAGAAGYRVDETWTAERRWFAALSPQRREC